MDIYRMGAVCNETAVAYGLWERPDTLHVRGRRVQRKPRFYLARETLGRAGELDQQIVGEGDDETALIELVPPGFSPLPGGEFLATAGNPGLKGTWTADVTDPMTFGKGTAVKILSHFPDRRMVGHIGQVQTQGAYMLRIRLDDWSVPVWAFPSEVERILAEPIVGMDKLARIIAFPR